MFLWPRHAAHVPHTWEQAKQKTGTALEKIQPITCRDTDSMYTHLVRVSSRLAGVSHSSVPPEVGGEDEMDTRGTGR